MRDGFDTKAAKRYLCPSTKLPWSGSTSWSIVEEVATQVATGGTRMDVIVGETTQMGRMTKSSEESRCGPSMKP
jgi:hypothetical protein